MPDIKIIRLLLENQANVNSVARVGYRTPLQYVLESKLNDKGKEAIVDLLVANGANINLASLSSATYLYHTPLGVACNLQSPNIAYKLMELGCSLDMPCGGIWSGCEEVAEALLCAGVTCTLPSAYRGTPLHLATKHNRLNTVRLLLQQPNIDLQATDSESRTALMHAIDYHYFDIAVLLYSHDKDKNPRRIALYIAEAKLLGDLPRFHQEGLQMLEVVLRDFTSEERTNILNTILIRYSNRSLYYFRSNTWTVLEKLVEWGVDVNGGDGLQMTALCHAIQWGNYALVTRLLGHGAFLFCRDYFGRTPYSLCAVWDVRMKILLLTSWMRCSKGVRNSQ